MGPVSALGSGGSTTRRRPSTGPCCATPTSTPPAWPGTSAARRTGDRGPRRARRRRPGQRRRPPAPASAASPATTLMAMLHASLSDMEDPAGPARRRAVRPCRLRRRPHGRPVPGLVAHAGRAAQRGGVLRRGRGPAARHRRRHRLLPPGDPHRRGLADLRRAGAPPAAGGPADARPLSRWTSWRTSAGWATSSKWAAAGEQVRLSIQPLPTMAVFGREVAMVSAEERRERGRARLDRCAHPGLVTLVSSSSSSSGCGPLPLGLSGRRRGSRRPAPDPRAADERAPRTRPSRGSSACPCAPSAAGSPS